jgi:outer membrane protein TolC
MRSLKSTLHRYIFLLTALPLYAQTQAPMPLHLSQAIDLALKQNRSLHLAELAVTDSQHKKEAARSAYFPHIVNDSSVHHITELAGVEIPAGAFGSPASTGPIPAKALFLDQGSTTSYTSGTQLEQPFTQMFKIRESNRAASADVETARVQLTQAENEIVLDVRKLYCNLLIAQIKLQAAQEQVSAGEVKHAEDLDAVTKGKALEVVALESQASLLEAQHSVLMEKLTIRDATLSLNDLLGLPLGTLLELDPDVSALTVPVPAREECLRLAREKSPSILAAEQAVTKAKAGLGAAKDAYIPDITGLARYSYQSGIPLLVHNFGTFGFNLSYDLFDGGHRIADIKDARTLLEEAKVNLDKAEDEVDVQVESAYDTVEQSADLVKVAQEALDVRTEAARVADRQFEQTEALASARATAHANQATAKSSLLAATLGLSIAQANLKQVIGDLPR